MSNETPINSSTPQATQAFATMIRTRTGVTKPQPTAPKNERAVEEARRQRAIREELMAASSDGTFSRPLPTDPELQAAKQGANRIHATTWRLPVLHWSGLPTAIQDERREWGDEARELDRLVMPSEYAKMLGNALTNAATAVNPESRELSLQKAETIASAAQFLAATLIRACVMVRMAAEAAAPPEPEPEPTPAPAIDLPPWRRPIIQPEA